MSLEPPGSGEETSRSEDSRDVFDERELVRVANRVGPRLSPCISWIGDRLRGYTGELPKDTGFAHGHEASSIDKFAWQLLNEALANYFSEFDGLFWTEDNPFEHSYLDSANERDKKRLRLVFIIDECEGTTNLKRFLWSPLGLGELPQTGVSIAISLNGNLRNLLAGAFYHIPSGRVLMAVRTISQNDEPAFLSYCDKRLLTANDFADKRGDSAYRIIVPGYSNDFQREVGELAQALVDSKISKPRDIRCYGGCRASAVDVISILDNRYDAYVDLRALLSKTEHGNEQNAMLQVYDICGVIPTAIGCGLRVTDPFGNPYYDYNFRKPIPLVVSRPKIHDHILEVVQPLAERWQKRMNGR